MEKIIDKIIEVMKHTDSLTDDEEIVRRGLEIIAMKIFFAIVITVAGLLMRCFFESILFTISFTLLRQYSGGYHADSEGKCLVSSILMLILSLSIIKVTKIFPVFILLLGIISLISIVYIFYAAPIDTPNKRLDSDEIRVYGKRARICAGILMIVSAVFWFLKLNAFASPIMTAAIMGAYLMIKGQNLTLETGRKYEY